MEALGGGAVSWKSSKQTCIARSTMESKFIALELAGQEAEWLRNLLADVPIWGGRQTPISLHCDSYDSQAALGIAKNSVYNAKKRHLRIRHAAVKQLLENGVIALDYVKSESNLADPFTKGLSRRIVADTSRGGRKAGVIIVIVVLDYGYVWWKGWKLPDFMFATKRGLKDACNSVSNELTKVFHSVEVTKKTISSTLNESSCKYDEIIASTSSDKDKDVTKDGVAKLLLCTLDADNRLNDLIQGLQPNRSLIFASDELWKHLPYQDSVEAQDEVAERMEMKHGLSKALGPLVAKPSLLPIDRFLMFASDGLWEHLTNRDQKSCNF